jgi:hypothetical protein
MNGRMNVRMNLRTNVRMNLRMNLMMKRGENHRDERPTPTHRLPD